MEGKDLHFILADSRSGSTLLQEYLDCHPDNTELGEVFNRGNPIAHEISHQSQINYLSCLIHKTKTNHVGCKITFQEMARHLEANRFFRFFRGSKYIVLERKNVVAAAVSLMRAQSTGLYHLRGSSAESKKIRVDVLDLDLLIRWRNSIKSLSIDILDVLECERIFIDYEGLVESPQDTINAVFSFMGMESVPTSSSLRKVGPKSLCDAIDNYEEVQKAFPQYAEFLP